LRGRLAALFLGLLFLLQGACFLNHPGIHSGEVSWGEVKSGLFRAVLAVPRPGPESLRFPMLAAGAFTVVCACLLLRRMAGLWALVGGLLLAADTTFLLTTRLDSENVVLPRLFLTAGCWLLLRFWQDTSRVSLALGFLCWGLGCACRPELALVLIGVSASAALVFGREIAAAWGWRNWLPAGLALLLGLAPLLAARRPTLAPGPRANIMTLLDGSAWFNETVRSEPGNWGVAAKGLMETACTSMARASGDPRHNLLALAALSALALGVARSLRPTWQHRRALGFSVAAALAAALLLPSSQYLLLWPLPLLPLGVLLAAAARRSLFGAVAVCAIAAAVALSCLAVNAAYYAHAVLYGGTREWTEAIYNLAADFDTRDARRIRILTPGIEGPLAFLRGGKLPLVSTSAGEDTLFIAGTGGDSGNAILAAVSSSGRRVRLARVIQDYQGRSIFVLFRLE
jgi:hypothetical protein